MLKQMKLSLRISLGIGVLILGYCLSMSLSYYNSRLTQKGLLSLAEFASTSSSDFNQKAIVAFGNQLKNYENAVLMGETEFIEDGNTESKVVQDNLDALMKLSGLSDATRRYIKEQLSAHERFTINGESVYNRLSIGDSDASTMEDAKVLSEQQESLSSALSEISIMIRDGLMLDINGAISDSINQNRANLVLFICVVFAAVLIIYFLMKYSILAPLHTVLDGLDTSSREVSKVSSQLASASGQLSEGASQQAASIEEASSSLEEMSSMTRQNAHSADQANNLMKETSLVVEKANTSMAQLTTSMQDISKASEEISKIIKTIDDIAFQTNLLALNAAVEAARAGEAGLGFAVVADEVRNLAMRAAEAAKHTSTLIEGTTKKIKDGEALVQTNNEVFLQVAQSAGKVGELVGEIAAASNEQANGIEQVSNAVMDMDKVVQQNAANSEQNTSTSKEMSSMAVQMSYYVLDLVRLVEGGKSNTNGHSDRDGYQPVKKSRAALVQPAKKRKTPVSVSTGQAKISLAGEITPGQLIPMDISENDFKDY